MSQGADPRPTEEQDQREKSGESGQPSQQSDKKSSAPQADVHRAQSPADAAKKVDTDKPTSKSSSAASPKSAAATPTTPPSKGEENSKLPAPQEATAKPKSQEKVPAAKPPRKSAAPIPILSSPPQEPLGPMAAKKASAPQAKGKPEPATADAVSTSAAPAKTTNSANTDAGADTSTKTSKSDPPKKSAPSTASAAPAPQASTPPSIPPRSHHTVKRSPDAASKKPIASKEQELPARTAASVGSASTASPSTPPKKTPAVPAAMPAAKTTPPAQTSSRTNKDEKPTEATTSGATASQVKASGSPSSTNKPAVQESPKTSHPKGSEPTKTAPSSASPAPSTTAPAAPTPGEEKPEKKADSVASEKSQKPKKPEPTYASLDEIDNEEVRRTWPKALGIAAASVLVLAGIYVGAQWSYASTVANGTTVAGIDIGGLGKEDATQKLTEELTPRLTEPAELTAEDLRASFDPTEAGITLDADATVEELIGFSMAPQRLLAHLTGGDEVEPQLIIDDSAFAEALEAAAVDLEEEPVNGTVSFSGGEAIASTAEDGRGIDVEQAKANILDAIVTENRPIALPVVTKEPEITQEITDQYFAQAQEMTVGPITVEVAETSVEIPVKDFTKTISVKAESAALDFVFDGEKLASEVLERTSGLLTEAEDAHFEFENGKPIIVPGKAGTRIDSEQLATNVKQAATQPIGERTAEVALVESAPQDSVEALEELGVKEKVATFSTPITNDYLRTENLKVAAKRITGYLVKPGEEFDLLEVIGPVTVANGYHAAGVVVNGIHTEGVGGGLSQVATTTYNTGFFAGMTDIAHRPHSYWFERYPAGRESTIFVGSIDMIWRNDSPHGVLMRSYVADGKLTVEAWSTETYKVETTTSPRSNVVAATMTTMTAANCEPQPIGSPGFTVTVTRKVTEIESGEVVIDEANTWRYKPDNGVTCKKASSKDDD